jgi:phage gp36-like protein
MTYCTTQDLTDRYSLAQLLVIADREGEGELDGDAVARAIADAAGEIDSYIGERYSLPLAVIPPGLTVAAASIAFYRLHPAAPPEDVRTRYEDALRWLKDIAAGKAGLDVGQGSPPGGAAQIEAPPRVFSRQTLRDF